MLGRGVDYFLTTWAEAAKTALGFFWKVGRAFVLGYAMHFVFE